MLQRFSKMKCSLFATLSISIFLFQSEPCHAGDGTQEKILGPMALISRLGKPFTGDLKKIKKRKTIRALVSYSKTNFFFDKGSPKGFEYEMMNAYDSFLNRDTKELTDRIRIVFIPVPFDKILQYLVNGRGDIAAAGLTITPEREKMVAFTKPYLPNVKEVVILNKSVKDVQTLSDLSGKLVYVEKGTSYLQHLRELSDKLLKEGKNPIRIMVDDNNLVTEDILDLVNADILKITINEEHTAEAWAGVLKNIVVRKDLAINTGGQIGWAVRKNNPELLASLNAYIKENKKGSLLGNILFKRYFKDSKWITNPLHKEEQQRFDKLVSIFNRYGKMYGFDALALAAQGYQESQLNQKKRSPEGAIGVMQVLPSTASDKWVDVDDIELVANNIHAGAKYLDFLRNRYFDSPEIGEAAKINFAWAAYNAGPAKINEMRKIAKESGYDPNRWFFNVEAVAAEKIGEETVQYVININKYYVAYRLLADAQKLREEGLKSIESNKEALPE